MYKRDPEMDKKIEKIQRTLNVMQPFEYVTIPGWVLFREDLSSRAKVLLALNFGTDILEKEDVDLEKLYMYLGKDENGEYLDHVGFSEIIMELYHKGIIKEVK